MFLTCPRARRVLALSALTLACFLLTVPLWAEPASLADTLSGPAKADYEAGRLLYTDGDYAGAALRFNRAYERSGDPRLLWNTAAARKGERRYAEVERLVQQYLADYWQITSAQRTKATMLLDTIQAFIADLKVEVAQAGAKISIDGVEVGTSPLAKTLRVDMGDRRVKVTKQGFVPFEEVRNITANTLLSVNLEQELREGRLRVLSPPDSVVRVDGKRVTAGSWEGSVSAGSHQVDVEAPDKIPFRTETIVSDHETETLHVELETSPSALAAQRDDSGSAWWWIGAGAALLAGGAVGTYFLLQEDDGPAPLSDFEGGTLGSVELRMRF
jgi:hypothetical protein